MDLRIVYQDDRVAFFVHCLGSGHGDAAVLRYGEADVGRVGIAFRSYCLTQDVALARIQVLNDMVLSGYGRPLIDYVLSVCAQYYQFRTVDFLTVRDVRLLYFNVDDIILHQYHLVTSFIRRCRFSGVYCSFLVYRELDVSRVSISFRSHNFTQNILNICQQTSHNIRLIRGYPGPHHFITLKNLQCRSGQLSFSTDICLAYIYLSAGILYFICPLIIRYFSNDRRNVSRNLLFGNRIDNFFTIIELCQPTPSMCPVISLI